MSRSRIRRHLTNLHAFGHRIRIRIPILPRLILIHGRRTPRSLRILAYNTRMLVVVRCGQRRGLWFREVVLADFGCSNGAGLFSAAQDEEEDGSRSDSYDCNAADYAADNGANGG
jgi:hypothetical protein